MRRLLFLALVATCTIVATYVIALRVLELVLAFGGPLLCVALALAGIVLPLTVSVAATWVDHSPESSAVRDCVLAAFDELGTSRKAIASDAGIPEDQLSRQLAGREHLSLWRLASVPGFMVAFAKATLARTGVFIVIESPEVAELIASVKEQTAVLRRHTPSKKSEALLPSSAEEAA